MKWRSKDDMDPEVFYGFIYLVRPKDTSVTAKSYVGKKCYRYSNGNMSNWKSYTGSSKDLQDAIEKYGEDSFEFIVLYQAVTRSWLTYLESYLQHELDVLTATDEYGERLYYNKKVESSYIPAMLPTKAEKDKVEPAREVWFDKETRREWLTTTLGDITE